jgi:alcohol dehydrogenase class IV
LRDLGVPREQLAGVAEKTLHERGLAYNPRSVNNAGELEAILLAAW